ncbi:MAG: hypothetical protein K8I60_06280, partial [Anaerolineae bacterium]|nr:hypothetical protein [Anaerolineae bacterium]
MEWLFQNLASSLIYDLLKGGTVHFIQALRGEPQQRALHDVYKQAMTIALTETLSHATETDILQTKSEMSDLLKQLGVKHLLLDVALEERPITLNELLSEVDAGTNISPTSFAVLSRFLDELVVELRVQAEDDNSPLHNLVSLGKLESIQTILKQTITADIRDLKTLLERLIQQQQPVTNRRIPFMPDPPPDDFVMRSREYDASVAALVSKTHEAIAITAALRGAGGFGKTTLARAICHDQQVRDVFRDGILWVTLGENSGEQARVDQLLDLVTELTGGRPAVKTLDAAKAEFRQTLTERHVLLVVDDVWKKEHLEPFLTGGRHCARLVTTRYKDTLPDSAFQQNLDAMKIAEAVKLLGTKLPDGHTAELTALAGRLGEWPLLLRLVNGSLRQYLDIGDDLTEALRRADEALTRKGLTAFDRDDEESRNSAVRATLGVSIDLLRNAADRQRFNRLAIFDEDVDIPLVALEKAWGADDFTVRETCAKLLRAALLLRFDRGSIRLHDVVRSFLRGEHRASLTNWNTALLTAYNPDGKPWHTIPNDGYLYFQLAYHLKEAGQTDELHTLLTGSR